MNAEIEYSAQFGGKDASIVALPHFRALKKVSKGKRLCCFPYPLLALILRVDGEISQFDENDYNIKYDRQKKYVSVDIVIKKSFYGNMEAHMVTKTREALHSLFEHKKFPKLSSLEKAEISLNLDEILKDYQHELCKN